MLAIVPSTPASAASDFRSVLFAVLATTPTIPDSHAGPVTVPEPSWPWLHRGRDPVPHAPTSPDRCPMLVRGVSWALSSLWTGL